MLFGKRGIVGLDIGSNAIKLVELKEIKNGYQLKNIGESLLNPDAIVDKIIVDHDAVINSLTELIEDLRLKTKNVVISISGNSVIIKKVSLAVMNDDELREAIPWELQQFIPQSIEDINYDFQVLPGEDDDGKMEVMIAAAKKDLTNDYIEIVNEVGLNPVVVDIDLFALENMYEVNYSDVDGILALVNIGATITNINILKEGFSIFTRDLSMGGNQYNEWIQKEFDVGYDDAENMKLSLTNEDISPDLKRITNEFIESICSEIKRTMDFFSSTFMKHNVNRIMICGGSSKVPQLSLALEDITNCRVETINPFRNISYNERDFDSEYIKDIAPKMGVAIGLALRRVGDKE
ncbi:MAG: type IV pilus biogenesis protein PilM [Thermodesulfobacteriota bacterium]